MIRLRVIIGGAAALALSGGLHAAGLLIAVPDVEPVEMAGGAATDIAALGAAFEDFVAGSVPAVPPTQPAVQATAAQPRVALPESSVADLAAPVDAADPATLQTVTSSEPVTAITEQVKPELTTAVPDASPATSIRPVARPAPRPQRTEQAAPARPAGNAESDAARGSAQGQAGGQAASAGAGPAQDARSGQAAATNYPGEVLRQITRLRRQSAPARGSVIVSFTIAGSGALADVTVAQSSGSAALDGLAVSHIRRAAPFPPPPVGAQTSFRFEFVGRR